MMIEFSFGDSILLRIRSFLRLHYTNASHFVVFLAVGQGLFFFGWKWLEVRAKRFC